MNINYTVSLNRVLGLFKNGNYCFDGSFLFSKHETLKQAKEKVTEYFKAGYFNHATIYSREDNSEIERFIGQEWRAV